MDEATTKLVKAAGLALAGIAVLIIVVVWVVPALSPKKSGDMSEAEIQSSITGICKDRVLERLKSPGTAEFSDIEVRSGPGPVAYVITGSVDSENTFGGTVRSDFTCESERFEGGSLLTTLTEISERH